MEEVVVRVAIVAAVVAAAAVFGVVWRRRQGRVRDGQGEFSRHELESVGLEPSGAATLALLLGSPTCAPCKTVRDVLAEVERERPDLRWVYADAADHLDLARQHHVLRVPTLFVLDRRGRILARTSGVPGKRDLLRVLDRDAALSSSGSATA